MSAKEKGGKLGLDFLEKLIGSRVQKPRYLDKNKKRANKIRTAKEKAQGDAKTKRIQDAIRRLKSDIKKETSVKTPTKVNRAFSKKYEITEGARLDPETGASVSAARSADRGEAGYFTRGKKSVDKGMAEAVSTGEKSRAERVTKLELEIKKLKDKKKLSKAETTKLKNKQAALTKLDKKSATGETSRITKAAIGSSTTKRKDRGISLAGPEGTKVRVGATPKEKDMLFGNTTNGVKKDGTIVGTPTLKQIQLAISDKQARSFSAATRERLAKRAERLMQKNKGSPMESSVGTRNRSVGFSARGEDKQVKNILKADTGGVKRRDTRKDGNVKSSSKTTAQAKKRIEETKRNPTNSTVGKEVQKMMKAIIKRGPLKNSKTKPRTTRKDGSKRPRGAKKK
tara:strand:- start:616 stop:1809 length:1194 start_codon:yes stop_codon:yes gene_type:complete